MCDWLFFIIRRVPRTCARVSSVTTEQHTHRATPAAAPNFRGTSPLHCTRSTAARERVTAMSSARSRASGASRDAPQHAPEPRITDQHEKEEEGEEGAATTSTAAPPNSSLLPQGQGSAVGEGGEASLDAAAAAAAQQALAGVPNTPSSAPIGARTALAQHKEEGGGAATTSTAAPPNSSLLLPQGGAVGEGGEANLDAAPAAPAAQQALTAVANTPIGTPIGAPTAAAPVRVAAQLAQLVRSFPQLAHSLPSFPQRSLLTHPFPSYEATEGGTAANAALKHAIVRTRVPTHSPHALGLSLSLSLSVAGSPPPLLVHPPPRSFGVASGAFRAAVCRSKPSC